MKGIRLFIGLGWLLGIAALSCNKVTNNGLPHIVPTLQIFKITGIEYDLQAGIKADSSFLRTDTINYLNRSNVTQANYKVDPYETLENNITIEFEDYPPGFPEKIGIDTAYYLPSIVLNNEVFYSSSDSLFLDHLSNTLQFSFKSKSRSSITITPTARTGYLIWGEYYRIRYSIPTKILLSNLKDNSGWELKALLKGSFITSQSANTKLHVKAYDLK